MLDHSGSLELRPFRLADADTVGGWLRGPGLSLPGGSQRGAWPHRLLQDARIVALVAWADARAVGLVRLDCGPDDIADITLVVAPECRRRGLGRSMFGLALGHARRVGVRRLVAWIDLQNEPACAFFDEMGFGPDGLCGSRLRMVRLVHAGDFAPPLDIHG